MRISPRARVTLTTAAALVALAGGLHDVSAQTPDRRFTQQMTEGTTYVVAFPQLWVAAPEKPTAAPMQLVITSQYKCSVTVTAPGTLDRPAIEQTVEVDPVRATRIAVPVSYMSTIAGQRVRNAIVVRATAPVSVYTTMAWEGGGELARHLPTTAWGTRYATFNLYQDRYGTLSGGYKYRPGQVLIIAQESNTNISYTPTVATEAGPHAPSVNAGRSGSIGLQQGWTFLVKAAINETVTKEWSSDLSGTLVAADKPIAVVSGHTKGAIMRYPDVLPPTGMFAAEAAFVRNGIHEALLPTSMAGTEFVTVPLMYTSTRTTGNTSLEFGIDDDRGDVIRIVALENKTVVRRMRLDGSGEVVLDTLERGEVYTEDVQESAARWTTSAPALMMQYGKSFAKVIPSSVGKKDDETLGQATVESGMPCMLNVPSVDRWASYAAFDLPEDTDNFLNVACKVGDASKIVIDGVTPLTNVMGGVRPINGTDYVYIRTAMAAGTHRIAATDPDVVFGAWVYGSLDGLDLGRAYGSAITVRLNTDCGDDSVSINDAVDTATGSVTGNGVVHGDPNCFNAVDVALISSANFAIALPQNAMPDVREMPFSLRVIDPTRDAVAVVQVASLSGKVLERTYAYKGAPTSVNDTDLDHSLVLTPNPVTGVLQVQGIDATAHVQIVTMAGAGIDIPASDRIDVSSLPPGPYMLKVVEGGVVRTARFVVVR